MDHSEFSRRDFLLRSVTGIGAAWLAAQWPEVLAAHEHARSMVASGAPAKFEFFTPEQAADVEAIAATIIPTTDTPGAREAGVVYFIDRGLVTFAKDQQEPFLQGLGALAAKTKEVIPSADSFASLSGTQQVEVLKALEATKPEEPKKTNAATRAKLATIDGTQILEMFRFATIAGFFANPEYGGNKDRIGWELIGFKPSMAHFPPFGYYDKEYREQHPPKAKGGER